MELNKVKIVISNSSHSVESELDLNKEKENFSNMGFKAKNFEWWVRPIQLLWPALREFDGNHFIVGYVNNLFKENKVPSWLYKSTEFQTKIEVIHE